MTVFKERPASLPPDASLTFSDVVENYAASAAEDAALQRRTVQVEAVNGDQRRVVVKYCQVA